MVTWLHPAEKKKKGDHWQVVSSRPDNHSEKISAVDARIQQCSEKPGIDQLSIVTQ